MTLTPEALETSTVSPTYELVEMIKVSRGFQLNAQMLSLQDQALGGWSVSCPAFNAD